MEKNTTKGYSLNLTAKTLTITKAFEEAVAKGNTPEYRIYKKLIPDLPDEEWRAIKGYKGKYLVSNMGRVKSLKKRNARLLTAFENNKGYLRVCLCQDG